MRTRFWPMSLLLLVVLLVSAPLLATAQEVTPSTPITIDGSENLQALLQTLADGYNTATDPDVAVEISTNGPNAAFTSLCNGNLDVVMSTRYITDEEKAICDASGITFIENVIGYQGLVVLASATLGGDDPVTCLSLNELDTLYGFGAQGTTGDVQLLRPALASAPLNIYAPAGDSAGYTLLESLLPSGDARDDAQAYESAAELVDLLNSETAGIAVLTYGDYEALDNLTSITTVSIQNPQNQSCQAPTQGNFETSQYVAQRPLALYVAQATLANTTLFLQSLSDKNAAQDDVVTAGFTGASAAVYARNMNNLTQPIAGRTFSRSAAPVVIDPAAVGEVVVGGTPLAVNILNSISGNFTAQFVSATIQKDLLGDNAAWASLCDGSAQVAITTKAATAEQLVACAEAGIAVYDVALGSEAVVFVVAAKNADLPTCLTTEALANIFAAPVAEASEENPSGEGRDYNVGPQNWQAAGEGLPDLPLYVLASAQSSLEIDWLLSVAGATNRWGRSDQESNVEFSADAAYRAEAVANFEGGAITVLRWQDFQNAPRLNELRVVEVDNGAGCVAPTEATITDGSYPISTGLVLHFSQDGMKSALASAFMWDLLGDSTISTLEGLGLVGFNGDVLRQSREQVFALIEAAQLLAQQEAAAALEAQSTAEATESATAEAEATTEATVEPTAEATEAATAEPTEAATVEPTAEATAAATVEATIEATVELTAEPTEEATAEATATKAN